ncbi:MAG TPA: UbiH/UbiF/VisC/COQ6 family ubiquinone biosynthesis hydroxylase [Stellaceae bacterium]|jgi:2-octaprenyl-6-methoxyphenol hydroxylase|nr:UbiH/UbiF/VisC/COQ6 family ubiquinone biosynthesis hydroxylase [Stellaceae bacterium]
MADDAELLIAGGGLNGLALGIACAGAGLETILVDRQDLAATIAETFDGRASAIAHGSKLVLDAIGVWPAIAAEAEPIREIRVADDASPLFLHYDHRDLASGASGATPLGYIVENRVLRRALLARAAELPALSLVFPRAVASIAATPAGVTATLGDRSTRRIRLVAAADGKGSPLRRAAGIHAVEWRYDQIGIVTTVRHERPHAGIAIEHFLPAGPFAILPMTADPAPRRGASDEAQAPLTPGWRSSLVWTEAAALAPRLVALPDAEFTAELRARFGGFLGHVEPVGPRFTYPLSLMQAETYIAPRLALIGEAAHVIHPIAGQGLNVGIRDVAALAEAIVDARRLGLDIGADSVLERYQRWRRLDAVMLAGVTDGLNRLFSNTIAPVKLARDLGLAAVNQMPPLKRLLMQHAMGTLGDRPRLARGEAL